MRIVVPVKQVATLDEDFEILDGGLAVDPDFLDWELNEWDRFTVEAALLLREAIGESGCEVVVVTVGDDDSESGLLSAMAMGADRGVRAWDDSLTVDDPLSVARVLASVIDRQGADLVLCGVQSKDAANGATGVAVAGYLGLPHVAVVRSIELDQASSTLTVQRELEGGVLETLRLALPALLTVQSGANEPRYANLRAVKLAKEKPLDVVELSDLGLGADVMAAAQGSVRTQLAPPDRTAGAEILTGSPSDIATRIREIVQERLNS